VRRATATRAKPAPASLARLALQRGKVSLDAAGKFREAVDGSACPHGSVPLATYRKLLQPFAYKKIWGSTRDQTLADAVARDLANELRFPPDMEPAPLEHICVTFVDRAVGKFSSDSAAFNPMRTTRSGGPPSLWGFVKYNASRLMGRVLRRQNGVVSIEEPLASPQGDGGRNPAAAAPDIASATSRLSTPAEAEAGLHLEVCQHGLAEAGEILRAAQSQERQLLQLLVAVVGDVKLTLTQRKNKLKAIDIVGCGIDGEPGHCIVLETGVGSERDPHPIPLSTTVSGPVAREIYGSPNSTVLTGQAADWLDELLMLVAVDPARKDVARRLAQAALAKRCYAHRILEALTETIAQIEPGVSGQLAELWRGPPGRDRTDGANGAVGVSGVGIAHIPFLFGLLNPLGERVPGLDQLLIE
jgi:hypothetical protein